MLDLFPSAPRIPVLGNASGDVRRSVPPAPHEHPARAGGSAQTMGRNDRESTPLLPREPSVGPESDSEGPPRLTAAQKAKGRAARDEEMMDVSDPAEGSATPTPYNDVGSCPVVWKVSPVSNPLLGPSGNC